MLHVNYPRSMLTSARSRTARRTDGGTFTNIRTIELTSSKGYGAEIDVEIEFTVGESFPATGPTYDCGGEPACGGEVEITAVRPFVYAKAESAAPHVRRHEYLECPSWLEAALTECIDPDTLTGGE